MPLLTDGGPRGRRRATPRRRSASASASIPGRGSVARSATGAAIRAVLGRSRRSATGTSAGTSTADDWEPARTAEALAARVVDGAARARRRRGGPAPRLAGRDAAAVDRRSRGARATRAPRSSGRRARRPLTGIRPTTPDDGRRSSRSTAATRRPTSRSSRTTGAVLGAVRGPTISHQAVGPRPGHGPQLVRARRRGRAGAGRSGRAADRRSVSSPRRRRLPARRPAARAGARRAPALTARSSSSTTRSARSGPGAGGLGDRPDLRRRASTARRSRPMAGRSASTAWATSRATGVAGTPSGRRAGRRRPGDRRPGPRTRLERLVPAHFGLVGRRRLDPGALHGPDRRAPDRRAVADRVRGRRARAMRSPARSSIGSRTSWWRWRRRWSAGRG